MHGTCARGVRKERFSCLRGTAASPPLVFGACLLHAVFFPRNDVARPSIHASRLMKPSYEVPLAQHCAEGPPQVASPPRAGLLPVKVLDISARSGFRSAARPCSPASGVLLLLPSLLFAALPDPETKGGRAPALKNFVTCIARRKPPCPVSVSPPLAAGLLAFARHPVWVCMGRGTKLTTTTRQLEDSRPSVATLAPLPALARLLRLVPTQKAPPAPPWELLARSSSRPPDPGLGRLRLRTRHPMPSTSRTCQFQRACSCGRFRSRQCLMLQASRPRQINQHGLLIQAGHQPQTCTKKTRILDWKDLSHYFLLRLTCSRPQGGAA